MKKELVTSDYFIEKLNLDINNKFVKKILSEYDKLDSKCREKEWAEISFSALVDIMDFQCNHTV